MGNIYIYEYIIEGILDIFLLLSIDFTCSELVADLQLCLSHFSDYCLLYIECYCSLLWT